MLHVPSVFSGVDDDDVGADNEESAERPSGSAPSCVDAVMSEG